MGHHPDLFEEAPCSRRGSTLNFPPGETSSEPGRELGTIAPGVLPSHQRRCSVDRWRSPGAGSGEGNLPATENDQCVVEPPSRTGFWSSHVGSIGTV